MPRPKLPEQFAQLEPLAEEWALASKNARLQKRITSSMEVLRSFYEALLPRMEEILEYLNQFDVDELPDGAERLFYLTLSLAEVAPAVELFKHPRVPDGFDVARIVHREDSDEVRVATH